jgi:hypothetical protein
MKLTRVALTPPPAAFDWRAVAAQLRRDALAWYAVEECPKVGTTDIRQGRPLAFAPPGSFDARRSAGVLYLRYVGEPAEPWRPWEGDARLFDDLEREPLDEAPVVV